MAILISPFEELNQGLFFPPYRKRRENFPKPEKTGRKRLMAKAVLGALYP